MKYWEMAELLDPTTRVHRSYLQACREFQAENECHWLYSKLDLEKLEDPAEFAELVQNVVDDRFRTAADTPQEGYLPSTHLWFVEGNEFLGRLSLRLSVPNDHPAIQADGNIGYEVRPTARRRGHAREMLRQALPIAKANGFTSVRITTDHDNVGSQRVIEYHGGIVEEHLPDDRLAYRIHLD